MNSKVKFMSCALAAVVALGGCSSDSGGDSASGGDSGGGGDVEVVAVDSKFESTSVSVPAGEVSLTLKNDGELAHNFSIESLGVDTGLVNPGESKTVTFTAPDEATEFVCNIHLESDDMKGTITPA